jgi:histidinol-phosphatase
MDEIRRRLDAAVRYAREAGESTLGLFHSRDYGIDRKADGSEVTAADRACETILRRRIETGFPGDAVIGEEFGQTPGSSAFRWVLDPIDGTASFVRGVPLYGTLLAIEHAGRPVAGVVYLPALDEMVFASTGGGAWHAARGGTPVPARVSTTTTLADALVLTTSAEYFRRVRGEPAWAAVEARAGRTRGWSDCYAHVLVATGRADASIEPFLHVWDIAATRVIVREAGGAVTDWVGGESAVNRQALCSNGRVHAEILAAVREHALRD